MAEGKKSFLLYTDQDEVFKTLPDDKAGKLIKLIFAYVNDENPIVEDLLMEIAFAPIRAQLKRDLSDWKDVRQVKSDAGYLGGKKSGEVRRKKAERTIMKRTIMKRTIMKQNEANEADALKTKQNEADEAVNANVNVNVNVNVKKTIVPSQFETFWKLYPRKMKKELAKDFWLLISKGIKSERPSFKEIRKAIHVQKEQNSWQTTQFIPYAANWLKNRQWEDPIEENESERNNSSGSRNKPKSASKYRKGKTITD